MRDRISLSPERKLFPRETLEEKYERVASERDDALARVHHIAGILADVASGKISPDQLQWAMLTAVKPNNEPQAKGARRRKSADRSVVYYIRMGDRIKIGRSTSIIARMHSFYAQPHQLLAVEPGSSEVETLRHHQFQHLRDGSTELFRTGQDLVSWIEELAANNEGNPLLAAKRINGLSLA